MSPGRIRPDGRPGAAGGDARPGGHSRRRASPTLVAGAILTLLIIGAAVFAPFIAPYSPTAQTLTAGLQPPSFAHLFGTDQLGRDIFSRVLFAARTDLRIALLSAIVPCVVGVTVGLVTGYFGSFLKGAVGWVSARVTDTFIAFPFYVLVIAIVFAFGAGEAGIMLTFALIGWVGYARVLGAMTAALRDAEWVRAARGAGLSHARVLVRHVLPNVLPQVIVLLATEIVLIMVAIVTLGYLGLGVPRPTPDWGTMIADGQAFVTSHWWIPAMPGLAVVITGIAFSMLGDGVGDALRVDRDPRRRRNRARGRDAHSRGGSNGAHLALLRGKRNTGTAVDARIGVAATAAGSPADHSAGLAAGTVVVGDADSGLRIVAAVDDRSLVDDVAFEVRPGEALGIVGESGSGKSLTLRALLGIMPQSTRIDSGSVSVGGRVGMVFQDPLTALDPLTRVGGQLREALRAADRADRPGESGGGSRAALQLLRDVGLEDVDRIARSYPHQLSGGQRQRIVIAMALAGRPDVLLCDEPTTALDVTVQRQVLALLQRLRSERGLTLLFVSHDIAVVAGMCERLAVMRGGRIVEMGETREILRAPATAYTRELLDSLPTLPKVSMPPKPPTPAPLDRYPSAELTMDAPGQATQEHPLSTREGFEPGNTQLEAHELEVAYGSRVAVSGVSFRLESGGALGIVGESGSGKTTIARVIVGQLHARAGQILLDGSSLPRYRSAAMRRAVQLVPQDPYASLNPRMTVGQTLGELLRRGSGTRFRTVSELLELARLDPAHASAYPHQLSGGQRQRVVIARALAVSPRVLVADEPTSALDVSVQAEIVALLQALRRDLGLTLVFVSHDLALVHALCDQVLVMRDGRAVELGGTEMFTAPRDPYTRQLLEAVPRLQSLDAN